MSVGEVTAYIGPMFASKTSSMINDVERYDLVKKYRGKCVIVKYEKDTRYDHLATSGGIVTHRGDERSKIPIVKVSKLTDVDITGKCVVGVDEGQFYPDAPEYIDAWASAGIHVVVACLDSTFQYKPFGRVAEIIAISEHVHKLSAICEICSANASFTKRIGSSLELEEIGGADKYIAVCRACR